MPISFVCVMISGYLLVLPRHSLGFGPRNPSPSILNAVLQLDIGVLALHAHHASHSRYHGVKFQSHVCFFVADNQVTCGVSLYNYGRIPLHEVKVVGTDCYTATLTQYQSISQCTFTRAITEADLYEAAVNVSATVTAFAAFTPNSTARLPVTLSSYALVLLPAMQLVEVSLLPSWQLSGALCWFSFGTCFCH